MYSKSYVLQSAKKKFTFQQIHSPIYNTFFFFLQKQNKF